MSEDDNLSPEMKRKIEDEKQKFIKENGKVELTITNDTSLQQERLWDDLKNTLVNEYQTLNIPFNPNSIQKKEDLDTEFEKVRIIKEQKSQIDALQKVQPSGVPLTGTQMGKDWNKDNQTKGERSTEQLKKIASEMPIDLMEFHSESEMLRTLEAIRTDTNHPSQREAERLLAQVLSHTLEKTGSVEYTGLAKDFGKRKGEWKKKKGVED